MRVHRGDLVVPLTLLAGVLLLALPATPVPGMPGPGMLGPPTSEPAVARPTPDPDPVRTVSGDPGRAALPPWVTTGRRQRVPVAADDLAGVRTRVVPPVGKGTYTVAPGSVPAPGSGPVRTVRVEVEDGLPVDATRFAAFVMATLNDPRGWGRGGALRFARTDGAAAIVVVLASPQTSARLCRPLVTHGWLSCRVGPRAVITHYRWVMGHPDYRGDLTGYRRYVVNHEVGHVLGHGHVACPSPGAPAPVMQQQTLGLGGCAPNPWPLPQVGRSRDGHSAAG